MNSHESNRIQKVQQGPGQGPSSSKRATLQRYHAPRAIALGTLVDQVRGAIGRRRDLYKGRYELV